MAEENIRPPIRNDIRNLWFEIRSFGKKDAEFQKALTDALSVDKGNKNPRVLYRKPGKDGEENVAKKPEEISSLESEMKDYYDSLQGQGKNFYLLIWSPKDGTELPLDVLRLTYGKGFYDAELDKNSKLGIDEIFYVVNHDKFYVFYMSSSDETSLYGASLLVSMMDAEVRKLKKVQKKLDRKEK